MPVITTIDGFIKNMALQKKWQDRKRNPFLAKGNNSEITAFTKRISDEQRAQKLLFIQSKLKAGMQLSGPEMEYLRKYAPELYRKAEQIEKEREEYMRELKKCKTKEEVQRLNAQKLQNLAGEMSTVMSSSAPTEQKLEKIEFISMRIAAIQNEHFSFLESPQYKALPSEYDEDEEKKKADNTLRNEPLPRPAINLWEQMQASETLPFCPEEWHGILGDEIAALLGIPSNPAHIYNSAGNKGHSLRGNKAREPAANIAAEA